MRGGRRAPPAHPAPSGLASGGVTDGGRREELPGRAEMERAFGLSFAGVAARTGAGRALDPLGADAATRGRDVMFRAPHPWPGQVAHELTHVLQQRNGGTGRGVSPPGSPAEREAERNALRVDLGLDPKLPQERASPDAVYRDVKGDLRAAMAGWGSDMDSITARLGVATAEEKTAVSSDPKLMAELRNELSRAEWGQALKLLGLGMETQIREAGRGWGTDEEAIYRAVETSAVPALKELFANRAVLLDLRAELTDRQLGRVLGTVASIYFDDAGTPSEDAYHVLMLFPESVGEACDTFERRKGDRSIAELLLINIFGGSQLTDAIIDDVDTHIENDRDLERIIAVFRFRWDVDTGRDWGGGITSGAHEAWSVGKVRRLHRALKQLPKRHITREGQTIQSIGFSRLSAFGAGYFTEFAGVIGISRRPMDLGRTIRHEVGHSVDKALDKVSEKFKQDAPNEWGWGDDATVWESRMPDPWRRKDGTVVPGKDQVRIKDLLTSFVRGGGKGRLRRLSGPGDVEIETYWRDDVPMIEAAKRLDSLGGTVWDHPYRLPRYGDSYFIWNTGYKEFDVFSSFVLEQRISDYSLASHEDFFAELYNAYYADGSGPERGKRLKVAGWKAFFDKVHDTL